MPGEDIQSWSVTAANNGNSDSAIEWREGQTRASVNNSSRSEMAAVAKHRNLLNGSISTTNSGNAYAFASGIGYTTVPTGLRVKVKIGAETNTSSATLNMDGIGDVTIKTDQGADLLGGELVANGYTDFLYNGSNWIFLYSYSFFWDLITGGGGIIIGSQIFATAGTFTYTPTPGMESCIIECVGGGGGGGCASSTVNVIVGGGGGGSGGYSRTYGNTESVGASQTVVVGAAGAAAVNPGTGGVGGDTSVGTLCIAKGGSGGGGSIAAGGFPPGGAGAIPGSGDITAAGSPGQAGIYSTTSTATAPGGGVGGSGCFGGGALGSLATFGSTAAGTAARNYGSGGGGSTSHGGTAFAASGAGSAGVIIITEFAGRGAAGRDGATGPVGPVGPSGPGTGDVLRSGTPTVGQVAVWTDASHIQGVAPGSLVTPGFTNTVIQTFTASGTYTPTAGMKCCIIECIGGGGGGGGVIGDPVLVIGGGGGGSGGYSRKRATAVDIGASKAVVVGSGGTVGTGAGSSGGTTSVGTLCVANGGTGGAGGTIASVGGGGTGASAGIGDVAATGASGSNGQYWNGAPAGFGPPAGAGGNSYYGGGGVAGQGSSTGNAVNGRNATGYGAGGGGASANSSIASILASGGIGSPGIVIITEFI